MAVSSLSAAKTTCELSGWRLSNLALQKILYIAHMFYIGEHNGEPLVDEPFEAWNYGPVLPRVYHKAKIYGRSPVQNIFHLIPSVEPGDEYNMLSQAVAALASASPSKLVAITHWDKGAWAANYHPDKRATNIIPNSAILEEYHARANG